MRSIIRSDRLIQEGGHSALIEVFQREKIKGTRFLFKSHFTVNISVLLNDEHLFSFECKEQHKLVPFIIPYLFG